VTGLHGRSTTDDSFYEWLLSDQPRHPGRTGTTAATPIASTSGKPRPASRPGRAGSAPTRTGTPARRGTWLPPSARTPPTSAIRAETGSAEPDEVVVARLREEFEIHRRVHWDNPDPSYRYPAHLTGPGAASYPPPPQPGAPGREAEAQ